MARQHRVAWPSAALAALALSACATQPVNYVPGEIKLEKGEVSGLQVSGAVTVTSMADDHTIHVLQQWDYDRVDYGVVSDALAARLQNEVGAHAGSGAGATKVIKVKVLDLGEDQNASNNPLAAPAFVDWIDVAVSLGGGPPMVMQALDHTSGFAFHTRFGGHDGALARAVAEILNNRDVRAYLAQSGASAPALAEPALERATAPAARPPPAPVASKDATAKLKDLKNLLDQGLITQQQYEKKRQEILDSM